MKKTKQLASKIQKKNTSLKNKIEKKKGKLSYKIGDPNKLNIYW